MPLPAEKRLFEPLLISLAFLSPAQAQVPESVAKSKSFQRQFSLSEDFRIVEVEGQKLRAYPLHNNDPALPKRPLPNDFSVTSPWLIIDSSGSVIQDQDLAYKASFTANFSSGKKGLARSLDQESKAYSYLSYQIGGAQAALQVTSAVSRELYSALLMYGVLGPPLEGAAGMADFVDPLIQAGKNAAMESLETQIKKALIGKDLRKIDSTQVFKDVMLSIVREASQELQLLSKELNTENYSQSSVVSKRIIDAESRAHAALAALQSYYSSGENFLVEQVAGPALKGTARIDIESIYKTHFKALDSYFLDLAVTRKRLELSYGEASVMKGEDLVLRAVRRAENEANLEKVGLGSLTGDYQRIRRRALSSSSGILDKIEYALFLSSLSPMLPDKPMTSSDYMRFLRSQREFSSLPPDKFIRKYDQAFTEALETGSLPAFAAAQSLISRYTAPPSPTTRQPIVRRPVYSGFDKSALYNQYKQAVGMAWEQIEALEKLPQTPERRAYLSRQRNMLNSLRRYESAFTVQEISPGVSKSFFEMINSFRGR